MKVHCQSWAPAVGLCAALISLLLGFNSAQAGPDFAGFLLQRDVVVDGTVLSADTVTVTTLGGCGLGPTGPYLALILRVQIGRVIVGTADDSVIFLTSSVRPIFLSSSVGPGTRVIAWGARQCDDSWRLWGFFCVVTNSGYVLPPAGFSEDFRLTGQPSSVPLRMTALDSSLAAARWRPSASSLEGQKAIALMSVRSITPGPTGFVRYTCDSLGWLSSSVAVAPQFIDFPLIPYCQPNIAVGDSIIVPIPVGSTDADLVLNGCPRAMRVKNKFIPSLGVPLNFLDYALRISSSGNTLKPIIAKDQ